jgi:phage shock protein PspC (stress-responsive transcriptional regulator)
MVNTEQIFLNFVFDYWLKTKHNKIKIMIRNIIERWVESNSFGVCRYLGDKMGLKESRVRLYFIYTSFATFGSPIILYLATAFWLNIKKYLREGWVAKHS